MFVFEVTRLRDPYRSEPLLNKPIFNSPQSVTLLVTYTDQSISPKTAIVCCLGV